MTAQEILDNLRKETGLGCSDGSCVFGHPGGMQTNGGCHCLSEVKPTLFRIKLSHFLRSLRKELVNRNAVTPQKSDQVSEGCLNSKGSGLNPVGT
jgi:hypothetical protein